MPLGWPAVSIWRAFRRRCWRFPPGRPANAPRYWQQLWEQMMDIGLTRTDAVIALGGGVVGDLAGFAAATILRGRGLRSNSHYPACPGRFLRGR